MDLSFQHCDEALLPQFCKQGIEFQSPLPKATQKFCTGARTEPTFLESSSKVSFLPFYAWQKSNFCSSIFSVALVLSYFLTHMMIKDGKMSSFFGIRDSASIWGDQDLIYSLVLSLAVRKHSPCRKKECSVLHNLQWLLWMIKKQY